MDETKQQPLSDKQIAEIRERAEKATPGPWINDGNDVSDNIGRRICFIRDDDDADFMANAREDIPALLADRDALAAEVEQLQAERILLKAHAEGAGSLLLEVQKDCIEAKQQNAAMREIVQAVAQAHPGMCWNCRWSANQRQVVHVPDCPVTKARALIAEIEGSANG